MNKMEITASEFFNLESQLIKMGQDSDLNSFAEIKKRLKSKKPVKPDEFARQAIYVVLASGFSQKTAKKIHGQIINFLKENTDTGNPVRSSGKAAEEKLFNSLIKIFKNKNKINAVVKLWYGRRDYCGGYYKLTAPEQKLAYLAALPHIGKITANHLARNLGENVFKRDVWIERLLKKYGEDLLERLEQETALPLGYVDVVLWKACQTGLIKL